MSFSYFTSASNFSQVGLIGNGVQYCHCWASVHLPGLKEFERHSLGLGHTRRAGYDEPVSRASFNVNLTTSRAVDIGIDETFVEDLKQWLILGASVSGTRECWLADIADRRLKGFDGLPCGMYI